MEHDRLDPAAVAVAVAPAGAGLAPISTTALAVDNTNRTLTLYQLRASEGQSSLCEDCTVSHQCRSRLLAVCFKTVTGSECRFGTCWKAERALPGKISARVSQLEFSNDGRSGGSLC